ncbi:MAG: hypothetical protein KGJ86_02080 [Chloroflexota bacterium]|nr:hypothetical protein [Chloroflexota bacterium]
MELQGKPTGMVCTEAFLSLSKAEAEALGLSNLPQIVLPHPVGTRTAQEIEQLADAAIDQVVSAIMCPAGR